MPTPLATRLDLYKSHGFEIIDKHVVNVNPMGVTVQVDLSATDQDFLVQVAVKKAYEAGVLAGEAALKEQLRKLLGAQSCDQR